MRVQVVQLIPLTGAKVEPPRIFSDARGKNGAYAHVRNTLENLWLGRSPDPTGFATMKDFIHAKVDEIMDAGEARIDDQAILTWHEVKFKEAAF